jgi:hypothetical protein
MVAKPTELVIDLASWYNKLFASRGIILAPHHYPFVAGLEDYRIDNLLFLGPAGTGKSMLINTAFASLALGRDPATTILSVSAGEGLPQGFMSAVMQVIATDPTWKEFFPSVRPDPQQGWSIQRGLFVNGHHPSESDASYFSCGIGSKALTGKHGRIHIYDDIHDEENASTPEARSQIVQKYYRLLMGRADPLGVRRIAAGRWWAEDDLYQEWIINGDWVVLQLPASRHGHTGPLYYDVFVPKGMECVYTETLQPNELQDEGSTYVRYRAPYGAVDLTKRGFYWPASPTKRKEYETINRRLPRIAAINYDGDMLGGSEAIFRESDFVPYLPPDGLAMGLASVQVAAWAQGLKGDIEQAWDTALGQPQSESLTVSLTGLLVPCKQWHCGEDEALIGPCDFHFDVWLLDALVAHLDFSELGTALREQAAKWSPRMVTIEEKQSGVSLLQVFRGSNIPLRGQKVEQGKIERAVNPVRDAGLPIPGGAASVQGWGRMGRIRYPMGAPWVLRGPGGDINTGFIRRVLGFAGGVRASDEFDALVHLVTRAIVRSRKHGRLGSAAVADDEEKMRQRLAMADDARYVAIERIGALFDRVTQPGPTTFDPFSGFCGTCSRYGVVDNHEWCALHGRATMALGGCSHWVQKGHAA